MDNNRFDVWVQDCMTRILPNRQSRKRKKEIKLAVAGNEVACFQVGIRGLAEKLSDLKVGFSVEVSEIASPKGNIIPRDSVDVLYSEYVPVHWNSLDNPPGELEGEAPGFSPTPFFLLSGEDAGSRRNFRIPWVSGYAYI